MDQLAELFQTNIEALNDCDCNEYKYIPQNKGQSLPNIAKWEEIIFGVKKYDDADACQGMQIEINN